MSGNVVELPQIELAGDRRTRAVRDSLVSVWNFGVRSIVNLILWLANKRQVRLKRLALLRVIQEDTRCRGCGFHGKRNWRGQIIEASVRLEFVRIQPTGQDPSTAAIRVNCLRCNAYWHEKTVQPAHEWVMQLSPQQIAKQERVVRQ